MRRDEISRWFIYRHCSHWSSIPVGWSTMMSVTWCTSLNEKFAAWEQWLTPPQAHGNTLMNLESRSLTHHLQQRVYQPLFFFSFPGFVYIVLFACALLFGWFSVHLCVVLLVCLFVCLFVCLLADLYLLICLFVSLLLKASIPILK